MRLAVRWTSRAVGKATRGTAPAVTALSLLFLGSTGSADALVLPKPGFTSQLPVVQVSDICRVTREGNQKVTHYCDDPYVCDRARPGMCKPGPALQRKLDEEARHREEELQRLAEQIRQLRAQQRAGALYRGTSGLANAGRAGNCSSISSSNGSGSGGGGSACVQPQRLSENVYHPNPAMTARYRPAVRPQPAPQPARLRDSLRFMLMASDMMNAMARLQPHDPARLGMEKVLEDATRKYGERGVDTAAALRGVRIEQPGSGSPIPEPAAEPTVAASPGTAEAGPPPAEPAQPAAPEVSAKDEALCSYLMTFEEGNANRLGVSVPDYCEPYLRSISREPGDANAPDPRRVEFALEDRYQIMRMKKEYEALFAPDFGE